MPNRTLRALAPFLVAPALLAVACGFPKSAPPPPVASPAALDAARLRWPDTTEAQLAEGRDLFVAKCDACHGHPDVVAIPLTRWPSILERMGKKASLDEKQTESVLRYVSAVRAQLTGETPKPASSGSSAPSEPASE